MALSFSQTQRISQRQTQRFNQAQIQIAKYLQLSTADLREEIFNKVNENPALEIAGNPLEDGDVEYSRSQRKNSDDLRMSSVSGSGKEKSEKYNNMLENQVDDRISLAEHLLEQFRMIKLPENQQILGEKLINNLNGEGCHNLEPVSFIDHSRTTEKDLRECISIIQNLDPVGCCCRDPYESLFIQAKIRGDASELVLFILDGHITFLESPNPTAVLKRIRTFVREEREKAFNTKNYDFLDDIDEEDIQDAISYITTLNPHPASDYSTNKSVFISEDILVENNIEENGQDNGFKIIRKNSFLPDVIISPEYETMAKMKESSREIKEKLQEARSFIESINYRDDSIYQVAVTIVNVQAEFFKDREGRLVSLKQKDVAKQLGLHESTVSRIVNEKYIRCDRGLFPFKYFFVSGVPQKGESDADGKLLEISKDKIVAEIRQILESQPVDAKRLSDQKLSEILAGKGIKVARRTVAKYRNQVGIRSSYDR